MQLDRFSSTDDHFELGDPGLHIVISHIDHAKGTYVPTASVTANKRRFYLPKAAAVIDLSPLDVTYHPKVLEVVQLAGLEGLMAGFLVPASAAAKQGKRPALITDDALWHDAAPAGTSTAVARSPRPKNCASWPSALSTNACMPATTWVSITCCGTCVT
jgi:hypothetical protein